MFSIIIPTWNNIACLKLCIDGIKNNSCFDHEIIVHVNEGNDGTLEWLNKAGIKYTHSTGNIGICLAVNQIASIATMDWLVYMNDDMVPCPDWDQALLDEAMRHETDLIFLSSTLIEPYNSTSPSIITHDCGRTPADFDQEKLLNLTPTINAEDRQGMASQPSMLSRRWFNMVGGYSIEFSPGMSSDDDLLMKLWIAGCRVFKVVGKSHVYHFSKQSTGRIKNTKGGRTFVMKWGLTIGEFKKQYLERSTEHQQSGFPTTSTKGRFRRAGYGLLNDYPLEDIRTWDTNPARFIPHPDRP